MPRQHHVMPFVAVAAGIATFSVMDALMKSASIAVGAYSAMLFRSIIGAMLMWPLWKWSSSGGWPHGKLMKLHGLRGCVSGAMATSFFWGLARMPMAEAIALSFIAPLIALYLAVVVLGESIGKKAVVASLLGFSGVVVIGATRMGQSGFSSEAALGIGAVLLSAMLYAWNLILQRQVAQMASPQEIAFFQSVFAGLFLALAAPWLAVFPDTKAWIDIGGSAVLAAISLMMIAWGYARAETQALLPIEYTAFIWAALLGWLMFAERLTGATLAGVALIVLGCWIAARKHTEQTSL